MQTIERLINEIKVDARCTAHRTGRSSFSSKVMTAIEQVPRHHFVSQEQQNNAYDNRPLPIGHDQTISQPYIVALMTDLLQTKADHTILEVGCGSGYQAAVLSRLVKKVISLEIISQLAVSARKRLNRLGYHNVEVIETDGRQGWPSNAPYDGILVAAAPSEVPPALIEQLEKNSHLIIPVGSYLHGQALLDIYKDEQGALSTREVLAVSFVPLTGSN